MSIQLTKNGYVPLYHLPLSLSPFVYPFLLSTNRLLSPPICRYLRSAYGVPLGTGPGSQRFRTLEQFASMNGGSKVRAIIDSRGRVEALVSYEGGAAAALVPAARAVRLRAEPEAAEAQGWQR